MRHGKTGKKGKRQDPVPDHWVFSKTEQASEGEQGDAVGDPSAPFDEARCRKAQRVLRFMEMREKFFAHVVQDPAFNILIDTYISECRREAVTVGDACIAARVPHTTALRAVQALLTRGELIRFDDPRDSRRKRLVLAPAARQDLERYVDALIAVSAENAGSR